MAIKAKIVRALRNAGIARFGGEQKFAEALMECGVKDVDDIIGLEVKCLEKHIKLSADEKAQFQQFVENLEQAHKKRRIVVNKSSGNTNGLESIETAMTMLKGIAEQKVVRTTMTPRQAIDEAIERTHTHEDKQLWIEHARLEAICGGCTGSIDSLLSAMRAWREFARGMLQMKQGAELPPTKKGLSAWRRMFKCQGTFSNYVRAVKLACVICDASTEAFYDEEAVRAKRTVKAVEAPPRERNYIRHSTLAKLVALAKHEGDAASQLLYIAAYGFMLRVPSEALQMTMAKVTNVLGELEEGDHSALYEKDGKMVLHLRKRKNLPHGSVIVRECWCKADSATCPVHAISRLVTGMAEGHQPLIKITAAMARLELRRRLSVLGVDNAWAYNTHDFRRGHAFDLQRGGASLCTILAAGQWKSASFATYLHLSKLEAGAVLEAHLQLSDGDD